MDLLSRPLLRITALFLALALVETGWLHIRLPLDSSLFNETLEGADKH